MNLTLAELELLIEALDAYFNDGKDNADVSGVELRQYTQLAEKLNTQYEEWD